MSYVRPRNVGEAVELLASSQGTVLAGGTDLCVYVAEGLCDPETLIDISGIESMRGIRREDGLIRVGACTTIAEVASSEALPACLRQGARSVGSPQIRNLGTIGGNVCNASPCGDTLAPLLTLDARFVLRSVDGARTVESGSFFTGPKQTILEPSEILESVEIPVASCEKASAFRMIGNRKGQAISQVNAAASLRLVDGAMSDVRVAVGSVAPVPLRLAVLEEFLTGKDLRGVRPAQIRGPILEGIRPIDDVRSTASYRQEVTVALVFDVLTACGDRISGEGEA